MSVMANEFVNPFPGMNPYLETRGLWPDVHNRLIGAISSFLRRNLPLRYSVVTEERVVIGHNPAEEPRRRYAVPDLAISSDAAHPINAAPEVSDQAVVVVIPEVYWTRQRFLTIREQSRGHAVTILEILSPTNKFPGEGRRDYLDKRLRILESGTHLLEVDLVRVGDPLPVEGYDRDAPYRILVSRSEMRPSAELYPFSLRSPIPDIVVPLIDSADEPTLQLNKIVNDLYLQDYYARLMNYDDDPAGPLSDDDRAWLDGLLRERELRH
jgi:hypothetical protein